MSDSTARLRIAYDYAVDRDQNALAWAIRAIVHYVPDDEKARPEPPRPARKPSRRLSEYQRKLYQGRPSWNGKPKRDWDSPDLSAPRWEMPAAFREMRKLQEELESNHEPEKSDSP